MPKDKTLEDKIMEFISSRHGKKKVNDLVGQKNFKHLLYKAREEKFKDCKVDDMFVRKQDFNSRCKTVLKSKTMVPLKTQPYF